MKKLLFPFVLLLFAVAVQAQIQDPVKFNSELKILAADEAEVVFTAAIDKGWHVYSTDLGDFQCGENIRSGSGWQTEARRQGNLYFRQVVRNEGALF